MSQEQIVPESALRQIKDGALQVRAAGEALTTRIKAFEAWLGKLPGRVEASCSISVDADGDWHRILSFGREGKEWALSIYDEDFGSSEIQNLRLLRDASISEKTLAVEHFPKLLQAMVNAQQTLVDEAARSASAFDNFAESIGLKGGN